MDNLLFKDYIETRARDLDVHPDLLTCLFAAVIRSKTEQETLTGYIEYLSAQIYAGAMTNKTSDDENKRQTAEYVLQDIDSAAWEQMNVPADGELAFEQFVDRSAPLKQLHYMAYVTVINDLKKLLDPYNNGSTLSGEGFLMTIAENYQDDIRKFKNFVSLFDNPIRPN